MTQPLHELPVLNPSTAAQKSSFAVDQGMLQPLTSLTGRNAEYGMFRGTEFEKVAIAQRGMRPNSSNAPRPTPAEMGSSLYQGVVGDPLWTPTGRWARTIRYDAYDVGRYLEVKSGFSELTLENDQLRLMVYNSVKEGIPLTLASEKPIAPALSAYLKNYGVTVEPIFLPGQPLWWQ